MNLFEKHKPMLDSAVAANANRTFFHAFPENMKAYGEEAQVSGLASFQKAMNADFMELSQEMPLRFEGEEVSPYLQVGLGIRYPVFADKILVLNAQNVADAWRKTSVQDRAGILIESLERMSKRFFEIAYGTMHTTGQSFVMSFQASGPHAADRALETIAMGFQELTRFPETATWEKPMGKYSLMLNKKWSAVPKGISLVIGCSTFPTWNTVPGMFASLITGNPVIVKPHPKAILPIAIVIAEMQKVLAENNLPTNIIQLAVDSSKFPLAKELAQHPDVKLIDFTGNSIFGNWLETLALSGKKVFTEKAGVNSVIIDSTSNAKAMADNLAFSVSLYSGQMCTAPQNFFIPEDGIETENGTLSFDETATLITNSIEQLVDNPKMGAGVLGCIQNDATITRVLELAGSESKILMGSKTVVNAEFENARTASPIVLQVDASNSSLFTKELFGPIVLIIKTKNTKESISLAKKLATSHGAISCAAYTTSSESMETIAYEMASSFTGVSFNLTGGIFVNQNAAFSDFHVTGGNPSGNASFTDPNYVNGRFVWVGHKFA